MAVCIFFLCPFPSSNSSPDDLPLACMLFLSRTWRRKNLFQIILGCRLFFRDYFLATVMVPWLSADNLLAFAQQAAPFFFLLATLKMGRNDNAGVECRLMISRTHV